MKDQIVVPQNLLGHVDPLVRQAGRILLDYFHKPLKRYDKKNAGFATDADLASESFLLKSLAPIIPDVSFCAEESGLTAGNDYQWVIDPLDGTTNFASGIPYFCVSVALTYKGNPIFGVIYSPITDEFFYAETGKGAFCNNLPIHVCTHTKLSDSILALVIAEYDRKNRKKIMHEMERFASHVMAIRRFGALALDLAYCAMGRFGLVVSQGFKWWDVAAGAVLLQEAGGQMICENRHPIDIKSAWCIAGNKPLCDAFFSIEKETILVQ